MRTKTQLLLADLKFSRNSAVENAKAAFIDVQVLNKAVVISLYLWSLRPGRAPE